MIKKTLKYLLLKIKWHKKLKFSYDSHISLNSQFEGMNKIYNNCSFSGYMGRGTYIAHNSHIYGKIGRYCSIASRCNIIQGVHPYTYPYVSTSPMFVSPMKQNGHTFTNECKLDELRYVYKNYPIVIGNDCWIGEGVSIIGGVKIGDGAVILAGAVVTKDVPPYAIVGGIPAQIIKYRYSEQDINFLLNFQWWNKDTEWLKKNADLFLNIEKFKNNLSL